MSLQPISKGAFELVQDHDVLGLEEVCPTDVGDVQGCGDLLGDTQLLDRAGEVGLIYWIRGVDVVHFEEGRGRTG